MSENKKYGKKSFGGGKGKYDGPIAPTLGTIYLKPKQDRGEQAPSSVFCLDMRLDDKGYIFLTLNKDLKERATSGKGDLTKAILSGNYFINFFNKVPVTFLVDGKEVTIGVPGAKGSTPSKPKAAPAESVADVYGEDEEDGDVDF